MTFIAKEIISKLKEKSMNNNTQECDKVSITLKLSDTSSARDIEDLLIFATIKCDFDYIIGDGEITIFYCKNK